MAGLKPIDPRKSRAYESSGYDGAVKSPIPQDGEGAYVNKQLNAALPINAVAQPQPATTPAAPAPAPTAAPTPARVRPSVLPSMPTQDVTEAARTQVTQNLGAGDELANKLYAPGSFGRVETPRQAETAALLKAQTAGLSGMSPQEQEAARTQAILKINDQANVKLRDISSRAAGNGLRGGVVAGENAQVAGAAQGAYASALQELMGKVQKSQVDASTALGNTLTSARGLEQGAQTTNLEAAAGELAGRLSVPFDYSNLVDAANTADRVETAAGTLRMEKGNDALKDMRELEDLTDEQLTEAEGDKFKTGDDAIDNNPVHAMARAYGASTFAELPPETQQQIVAQVPPNSDGTPRSTEEAFKWLNHPANKDMLEKLKRDARQ